ncbi:Uncharacterised protein [Klebsiella michiganensis]|uniref:Uncharacterized protein n=1 Tax=Klebsiella michiganensis TaxID=1134687 RepID=A0A7H4LUJ3_9ENTR|nr:Uncharacterised protein [Klebsiella michiganensis]
MRQCNDFPAVTLLNKLLATAVKERTPHFRFRLITSSPVFFAKGERIGAADGSRIVDQNIYPAHGGHGPIDNGFNLILRSDRPE